MLPLLLALFASSTSDGSPSDWSLPEGLEATLWAESPQLFNPSAIDVDASGRVWVAEAVNYRRWDGRNPGREHGAGDRIVVLEDTDLDGRCDRSTVFAQDTDLVAPLGIAVIGSRVFVSCSPHLFVYEDTDGDLVADRREVFLTGFGGHDHDHGLHSVVAGPGGRLVFNAGNAGPHVVTDRAGWTLRSGSLYNGGGATVVDNKPRLVSDDGRVWTGGLVLRTEADGTELSVLAHNFRNNYEVAVDSFGDFYQSDNDDDGNRSCRVLWCLEAGNHGYFSADGSRYWTADRRPGQTTERAHWHQDDPGVVPAGTITGAGGPTGVAIYEGELLADWIDGAVLSADAGAGVVFAHTPQPRGAGFDLVPPASGARFFEPAAGREDQKARWFRPSDVSVGVDGALFVADWYDPGVGGHQAGDGEAYGRILRIAPGGARPNVPSVDLASVEGAARALASPAVHVRAAGASALAELGDAARGRLREMLHGSEPRLAARALWVLAAAPFSDQGVVDAALAHDDERLRVVALRARANATGRPLDPEWVRARKLARDPSAAVRREVLVQLRHAPLDACLDLLLDLAEGYDGVDRTYLEAFGVAAEGREEELYAELAAELGDVPGRWDARFEGLAWRLHPRAAVDAWTARAQDPSLSRAERRRAVDALAFTPGRAPADAMALVAEIAPDDTREAARWWLRDRATNDWRGFELPSGPTAGLERAEEVFRSEIVRAGTVTIDVDVSGAETLWLVADDADDGNACDWVAWLEPEWSVDGERRSVVDDPWIEAEAQWGSVRVGANCAGGPLAVGERSTAAGLGAHALARIAYRVPEGAQRFVCEAGPDNGGTAQNGGTTTSVRFSVWLERPPDTQRFGRLEEVALDTARPMAQRRAAAEELALDARGALRWIRHAREGQLAPELAAWIAPAIHRNPDFAVRALASEHFPREASGGGPAYPSLGELLELEGDPAAGRHLLHDRARTQCLTCHRFTNGDTTLGGAVGPDLSEVHAKLGRAELFDAILNPSAGIAFGYDTWMISTKDAEVFAGFLLADGEAVVLQDSRGERYVVPAEEIETRAKQSLSTMPEGVALGLTPQELADLVAALEEPRTKGTVEFGEPELLFNGTDLSGWTAHTNDPSVPIEEVWSVRDGVLACSGEPVGYLRTEREFTSFLLTLEWRFDPELGPGNSGVLMRLNGPDQVWPRSIEAQLHHANAGDIWNIDAFEMETDPGRTDGRRTTRLQLDSERPLGEWNHYEILLDGPRLTLRVNGVLQNVADWCEEVPGTIALQSEGAAIEFRNIELRPILR